MNNDYENDDLITFQLDSKTINLHYSQFVKYSKLAREEYLFTDFINRFPQELHKFQEKSQISPDNIVYFFQLLQQNHNIDTNSDLTCIQCIDLLKISQYLEIRKLSDLINKYLKEQSINVDFIIQMIDFETKTQKEIENCKFGISKDMENLLTSKIDECFLSEQFASLPISVIYRIIKKCSNKRITCDKLFDFIKKNVSKYCVLFSFVDLQKLSESRLEEICELYSKSDEISHDYFIYLECNLSMIKEMCQAKKILEERLKKSEKNSQTQKSRIDEIEIKIKQLEMQLKTFEKEKMQIQKKLSDLEKEKNNIDHYKKQIQKKLDDPEKEKKKLLPIPGKVIARVKRGLLVSAQIKLDLNNQSLDCERSKYIVSMSDAVSLEAELYDKGESITSVNIVTKDFVCKAGLYFVRCLVFDTEGKSKEIISNGVRTSGESVSFSFEGCMRTVSLLRGQYKLEVWGAKGGDSGGERWHGSPGKGGLGGYSKGVLKMKDNETIHIFVGGQGSPADSLEGVITSGGFPDGGGAKTGHYNEYTSVPGTGGGSTSIRIGDDTIYSRVIVAGGGGGAGGSCYFSDNGGFGGGLNGGGCFYHSSMQVQGAGTQTGSTGGCGFGSTGNQGRFGEGAEGAYHSRRDSGGGGGGGWYGGGSGGYGCVSLVSQSMTSSSSGGGGSGWVFTASSYSSWKSGDGSTALKFVLNSLFFLADAICVSGEYEFPSPEGNQLEKGHAGNGHAKITPQ